MLTRTNRFQFLAFLVIAVVGIGYVAVRYLGFEQWIGVSGYTVKVDLPESGGLFSSAEVTYRGVTVGRVGDMRLTRTGIQADLNIASDSKIPRDVEAVVADRSVIGEQYLDLRPRHTGGPYLVNGSVIARGETQLPPQVQDLLLYSDQLADSVPIGSLRTVVNELYNATDGVAGDLQTLVTSSKSVLRAAIAALPQTITLITNAKTVLDTQQNESSSIAAFAANLKLIGEQLRSSDGHISKLLTTVPPALQQTSSLIDSVQGAAGTIIAGLFSTSHVFYANRSGVRELLAQLPVAVTAGGAVVTPSGINVGLVPTFFDPLPCTSGYGGTKVRGGLDTTGNPALNTKASCTATSGTDLRGAQHAPGSR